MGVTTMSELRTLPTVTSRRARRDEGFTMIELMVALLIFSIFLTVVMASIISLTKASTKVQVTSQSSSAELSVFQRIDREIRYADSINYPGVGAPSGDMYIEFRTPATSTASGATLCTQWRYDLATRTVQNRFWNDGSTPTANWQTDLTNVPNDGGANYPFQLLPATNATTGSTMQELKLTLDTGNVVVKGAAITTTFVARNSSTSSPSNTDNTVPGKSDYPICTDGNRP
jgi:prepilin-type N-terminal cleavage/methylation domain-containing protein